MSENEDEAGRCRRRSRVDDVQEESDNCSGGVLNNNKKPRVAPATTALAAKATAAGTGARRRDSASSTSDDEEDRNDQEPQVECGKVGHIRRQVLWGLNGHPLDGPNDNDDDDDDDDDDSPAGSTKEDRIAGALENLSDLLLNENEEFCRNYNHGRPGRAVMHKYDAAAVVVSIVKSNSHSVRLLERGFFFLSNWIHDNPKGAAHVTRHDLAAIVVASMRRFPVVEDLQWRALEALDYLHYYASDDDKKHFVNKLGGVKATVSAMKRYPDNFHLQDRAIALLAWICQVQSLREEVIRAGALGVVVTAAERHGRGIKIGDDDNDTGPSHADDDDDDDDDDDEDVDEDKAKDGDEGSDNEDSPSPPKNELRWLARVVANYLVPLL